MPSPPYDHDLTHTQEYHMAMFLGIDPSSSNLGWVLVESSEYPKLTVLQRGVLKAKDFRKAKDKTIPGEYPELYQILSGIFSAVRDLIITLPELAGIFIESPFVSRFPKAYAALVLVLHEIHRAAHASGCRLVPVLYAPMEVKKVITYRETDDVVTFNPSANKEEVRMAVLTHEDITLKVDTDGMTEHEFDAVAIAYSGLAVLAKRKYRKATKK